MRVQLTPSWSLTTGHAKSSCGIPVLVDRMGNSYGTHDVIHAYPSWGYMTAAAAVSRMATHAPLTMKQQQLVRKFVSNGINREIEMERDQQEDEP